MQLNEFLSVIYDGKWLIGTAVNISPENQDVQLSFLHPHGPHTHFHWPDLDLCWIKVDDIIGRLPDENAPKISGTRNLCLPQHVMLDIERAFLIKINKL